MEVKGKGSILTYFVAVEGARSATTRHSSKSGDMSDRGLHRVRDHTSNSLGTISDSDEDAELLDQHHEDSENAEVFEELQLEQQLKGYLVRSERK